MSGKMFFRFSALMLVLALLVSLAVVTPIIAAPTPTITVNAATVINDVTSNPIGINMDYWMDDPALRAPGARSMASALQDMGVKYLRYPGGEKADGYLWSVPPFTAPNPKLARISSQDWPANDAAYWTPVGDPDGNWSRPIYDFDEFMADCIAIGGEPVIVVAYDGIYKSAYPDGTSLTRQQAIDTAVAWVRYANITKGYNVKYWSIGNETWNPGYMGGTPPSWTQLGIDVAEFATAMKAVDPTIKIGLQADSESVFDAALAQCQNQIDFLDVHSYPGWVLSGYAEYARNGIDPTQFVTRAQNSINRLSEPNKSRLFIAQTETGPQTFNANWNINDTGHGLLNAEIFGKLLSDSRVKFSQFWNTHWINNNTNPTEDNDALTKTNGLTAEGLSMKVIHDTLLDSMVSATSASSVYSMASKDSTGKLNILLINRATTSKAINVALQNYTASSTGAKWVYKGTSNTDVNPAYTQGTNVTVSSNKISVTLDPSSITVIKLN